MTRRQNPTPDPGIFQVFNERSGDFSILAHIAHTDRYRCLRQPRGTANRDSPKSFFDNRLNRNELGLLDFFVSDGGFDLACPWT